MTPQHLRYLKSNMRKLTKKLILELHNMQLVHKASS